MVNRPWRGLLHTEMMLVLFASGIAYGSTQTDTFTGCLTPGGDLKNVAIGDTPTGECKGNAIEVTWNAEGPTGPQGPTGPPGPVGPPGEPGQFELVDITWVPSTPVNPGGLRTVSLSCPLDGVAISGRGPITGPIAPDTGVLYSAPGADGDWEVKFRVGAVLGYPEFTFRLICVGAESFNG